MKLSGTKAGRRIGLRLPAPPRFKRPSRGKLILLAVCALLTLACVALCFVYSATAGTLLSQQAAERYRGENEQRFAQATSFFPAGAEKGIQDIRTFRSGMDGKLLDVSLEAPEGAPALWFDAYSGTGELTVTGSKGTATVPATGVGGEWFSFHPLELRSGGYITEDELMHDRVILDEKLAWQLFGGYDLAGLTVTISGKPYVIAGVVAMEDDRASARAHETNGEIFLHFDALQQLTGGDGSGGISCYELVCAEPISGFTLGLLTEGFKDAVTVQNTGRFSVKNEAGAAAELRDKVDADERRGVSVLGERGAAERGQPCAGADGHHTYGSAAVRDGGGAGCEAGEARLAAAALRAGPRYLGAHFGPRAREAADSAEEASKADRGKVGQGRRPEKRRIK